jgi:crotonobetainyl-CoA:carnitine CoA-transferase CaiB-like acyl-CoA transferase
VTCDVIVENYSPRVTESWGLRWEDLHAARPDLIMVRMPAFGLTGPWRDRTGFAMTMEQVSGMSWLSGFPEHSPVGLFGPCDPSAGLHALVALMAALEHRRRTGEGRLVEVPMVASALHVAGEQVIEHSAYGVRLDRDGNRGPAAAPQNCYQASDMDDVQGVRRWVAIAVATDEQWRALVEVLGNPAWALAPELSTRAGRREQHDLLDRALAAWCAERRADEIVGSLIAHGVPAEPVVHPTEHLQMAQLLHRGFFETVDHPVHGTSTLSTYPFRLPGHAGSVAPHAGTVARAAQRRDPAGTRPDAAADIEALEAQGIIGSAIPT